MFKRLCLLISMLMTGAIFPLGGIQTAGSTPLPANQPQYAWQFTTLVDKAVIYQEIGEHALQVDSQGHYHAVFGGDHLYYAVCSAGSFLDCEVQTVDPAETVGMHATLALDSQERPHIAYYASGNQAYCNADAIKYAHYNGSAWEIEVVEQDCVSPEVALALDGADHPVISFSDLDYDSLKIAERQSGVWNTYSLISDQNYNGLYSSLAFDNAGNLHLSYISWHNDYYVWHKMRAAAGGWEAEVEVDRATRFMNLASAVDPGGQLHLGYSQDQAGVSTLRHAVYDGSAWSTEEVAPMDYQGQTAILIGIDNRARIAFTYDDGIAYTKLEAGGWISPSLIITSSHTTFALAGDAQGDESMLLANWGHIELATQPAASTSWGAPQPVQNAGEAGLEIAMRLDTLGNPHIGYYDAELEQIRYAWYDGAQWHNQVVTGTFATPSIDLALDSQNRAHFVFDQADPVGDKLYYTTWDDADWLTSPPVSNCGGSPSIDLDAGDLPNIAFYDCNGFPNPGLSMAVWNGADWDREVIDAAGSAPALQLDSLGQPHLSYRVTAYPDDIVRYATRAGAGSWDITDVHQEYDLYATALALNRQDQPQIVYETRAFADPSGFYTLGYAHYTGTEWVKETASADGYGYDYALSLALDAMDASHLAYCRDSALYYANRAGGSWTVEDYLDSESVYQYDLDFGVANAIVVSPQGEVMIAYYGGGDLKFAKRIELYQVMLPGLFR